MEKEKILSFSLLGSFLAITSSAVGLGNIWKFPTMIGQNGGGAFLLLYILACLLIGIPIAICEFFIGHKGKSGPVESFSNLGAGINWKYLGISGIISSIIINAFYSDVIGWVLGYSIKTLNGSLFTDTVNSFDTFVSNPFLNLFYKNIVLVLAGIILYKGAVDGVQKVIKITIPFLLFLIMILAGYGLSMDGAGEGLKFLFYPDFSKIGKSTILDAMGLAFFKLSIGSAILVAFAHYFPKKISMTKTALQVVLADLAISILAGIAIFPAIFTYGLDPNISGPGLIFQSLPQVFAHIKFGSIFCFTFFVLAFIAGLGALVAISNTIVEYFNHSLKYSRIKSISFALVSVSILGILPTLSLTPILSDVLIFGQNFFDFFDYLSSNLILPINSLFMVYLIAYKLKEKDVVNHLLEAGEKNEFIVKAWYKTLKYVVPFLIIVVFLSSLGLI